MRVALLPPDERPNTRGYAVTLGEAFGIETLTPPEALMPRFRQPADSDGLIAWLRDLDGTVDHFLISLELLGLGGLIPSRNGQETTRQVIDRIDVLRELTSPVTAYGVIQRLPGYDNASRSRQEPEYWATHGECLSRLSRMWDEIACGERPASDADPLLDDIPADYVQDLLRRRMRNHAINLAALEMEADGVLEFLILSSDDTAPRGLPASERRTLSAWASRLDSKALLYPGADEVPSLLMARLAVQSRGAAPRIAVECPDEEGMDRIAPYEDRPFREGVATQVSAVGGVVVDGDGPADLVLVVHPPAIEPGDWVMNPPDTTATPDECSRLVAAVQQAIERGLPVAVVDVRYANGGDPALLKALDEAGLLGQLAAYGGWNTAGNSLGTTLAAGISAVLSPDTAAVRERFLARKVIEDGYYLPVVRKAIQDDIVARGLLDFPLEELPDVEAGITAQLDQWAQGLQSMPGWRVRDARLPWTYAFTIDFILSKESRPH